MGENKNEKGILIKVKVIHSSTLDVKIYEMYFFQPLDLFANDFSSFFNFKVTRPSFKIQIQINIFFDSENSLFWLRFLF